jgi:hypothetical protein
MILPFHHLDYLLDLLVVDYLPFSSLRYLEQNAMPFWSRLTLKVGDMVISLGNQSAGSNNMLTGMCGVVTGFESVSSANYASSVAARWARSPGSLASRQAALSKEMTQVEQLCK